MFKKFFILVMFSAVFLSGCISSQVKQGEYYRMTTDAVDPEFNVVEMKNYGEDGKDFTFMYDKKSWEIEEWGEEEAPNHVVLVNKKYEDRSCYLMPGSVGHGGEEGQKLIPGVLLTTTGKAETLDIYNAAGIRLRHIVAYTIDDVPYIFELTVPASNEQDCLQDGQMLTATFAMPGTTPATEETATTDVVIDETTPVDAADITTDVSTIDGETVTAQ